MPPRRRTYGSDQTGRCAGDGARPSEAHDERDGGRGPGPRQCLEQDRLSTENVKPLRASVTEGDKDKAGTKITLDSAPLSHMAKDRSRRPRNTTWAGLMRRAFAIDVLACPRCGGRLRMVGAIEYPVTMLEILGALRQAEPVGPDPPSRRTHDGETDLLGLIPSRERPSRGSTPASEARCPSPLAPLLTGPVPNAYRRAMLAGGGFIRRLPCARTGFMSTILTRCAERRSTGRPPKYRTPAFAAGCRARC